MELEDWCTKTCISLDFSWSRYIQKWHNDIKTGLEKVLVCCGAVMKSFGGEAGAFGGEASPPPPPLDRTLPYIFNGPALHA